MKTEYNLHPKIKKAYVAFFLNKKRIVFSFNLTLLGTLFYIWNCV